MARHVSARAKLPGPFRRLIRQPLRAGAVALLALTALAAAGVQSNAALVLRTTMDQNWRGAYDILVSPADALQSVDGDLPPNTLSSGSQGMTLADLDEVRAVAGVDLAAPLGEIVIPELTFGQARVAIPRHFVGADDAPQAYRVTSTYTTDDGLGERIVDTRSSNVVIDEGLDELGPLGPECPDPEGQSYFDDYLVDPDTYPALTAALCSWSTEAKDKVTLFDGDTTSGSTVDTPDQEYLELTLPSIPRSMTRVTLVDPISERALLGDPGAFLDPLIGINPSTQTDGDDVYSWAEGDGSGFGERFLEWRASTQAGGDLYDEAAMADLRRLYADNGDDFDAMMREMDEGTRYFPVIAAPGGLATLSLKIDVDGFGDAPRSRDEWGGVTYELPSALEDGGSGVPIGNAAGDVSGLVNPFISSAQSLVWPGADLAVAEALPERSTPQLMSVARTESGTFEVYGGAVTQTTNGYLAPVRKISEMPGQSISLSVNPETIGSEAAYTGVELAWSGQRSIPTVIVGEFDPASVDVDESATNYVPLGAYAPVGSTVSSGDHAGATMLPSLTGLGLVSPRTVAIGSIYSAGLWNSDTPISAIRVRVAGIDGYTDESQQRVVEVAQAIESLGFSASIVAGSSPTDVDVAVDGYAFGTMDPAGTQTVGALGTVTQRWSELGAAARVSLSISGATLGVLGIALAASVILFGAVQLAGVPARREQSNAMREVGFTRARIARWYAAEEAPGLILVALVAAGAVWISGGTQIARIAALIATGVVLVASVTAVIAGSRARPVSTICDLRSRRLGARSVAGFGVRQVLVHPLTSVIHGLAIVIVAASAAVLSAVIVQGRTDVGTSSLAAYVIGQLLIPQIILGIVGVVGGVLLAGLTRRLSLGQRSGQWATLRAAGWTSGQLGIAQLTEALTISLPAIALSCGLGWLAAQYLGLEPMWLIVAVSGAAATLAAIIISTVRRKGLE